jgi:hypothetical protein
LVENINGNLTQWEDGDKVEMELTVKYLLIQNLDSWKDLLSTSNDIDFTNEIEKSLLRDIGNGVQGPVTFSENVVQLQDSLVDPDSIVAQRSLVMDSTSEINESNNIGGNVNLLHESDIMRSEIDVIHDPKRNDFILVNETADHLYSNDANSTPEEQNKVAQLSQDVHILEISNILADPMVMDPGTQVLWEIQSIPPDIYNEFSQTNKIVETMEENNENIDLFFQDSMPSINTDANPIDYANSIGEVKNEIDKYNSDASLGMYESTPSSTVSSAASLVGQLKANLNGNPKDDLEAVKTVSRLPILQKRGSEGFDKRQHPFLPKTPDLVPPITFDERYLADMSIQMDDIFVEVSKSKNSAKETTQKLKKINLHKRSTPHTFSNSKIGSEESFGLKGTKLAREETPIAEELAIARTASEVIPSQIQQSIFEDEIERQNRFKRFSPMKTRQRAQSMYVKKELEFIPEADIGPAKQTSQDYLLEVPDTAKKNAVISKNVSIQKVEVVPKQVVDGATLLQAHLLGSIAKRINKQLADLQEMKKKHLNYCTTKKFELENGLTAKTLKLRALREFRLQIPTFQDRIKSMKQYINEECRVILHKEKQRNQYLMSIASLLKQKLSRKLIEEKFELDDLLSQKKILQEASNETKAEHAVAKSRYNKAEYDFDFISDEYAKLVKLVRDRRLLKTTSVQQRILKETTNQAIEIELLMKAVEKRRSMGFKISHIQELDLLDLQGNNLFKVDAN